MTPNYGRQLNLLRDQDMYTKYKYIVIFIILIFIFLFKFNINKKILSILFSYFLLYLSYLLT